MSDNGNGKVRLERAIRRARERNIVIPTFRQMIDPGSIPQSVRDELKTIGLWEVHPRNLFRITWHNEPKATGGGFGAVNTVEFPPSLTGVPARIIALVGKWFPTGAHKVGATFACLVPSLVTGGFDPTEQKAVWPSTGNYCRGGAYNSALLGCESIAILPEQMSRERFEWLSRIAGQIIRTPGSESNVKEIFDKCAELKRSGADLVIFNQFEEFGNYLWHHEVTGRAMAEVLERELAGGNHYHGVVLTTGSAGTIACGDYLKQLHPGSRIAASEALQCPTLLENGFGAHRIEGIGDKHIPWIHNVKNTDMVMAIDDNAVVSLARLFNEKAGRTFLQQEGVPPALVDRLDLLGFSGIANLLSAVKYARYYELGGRDVVLTVLTDSMELYSSRLEEMRRQHGPYSEKDAVAHFSRYLQGAGTEHVQELSYRERRRVHNLKYYTWVEQQGRTYQEILDQWNDPDYWPNIRGRVQQIDERIEEFNRRVGLLPPGR